MRNHFVRSAVEMVFGRQIVTSQKNAAVARASHGSREPTLIVGICCVFGDQKRKQQKSGKAVSFADSLKAMNIQYLK